MWYELKPKYQDRLTRCSYHNIITESICTMFDYQGFPDSVNTRFIPIYNTLEGGCAFWKSDKSGEYIVSHVDLGGEPDANGLGTLAICSTDNGEVKEFKDWKNNPDIVVMFNNSIMSPDLNIDRFADILTEVDKSMKLNVIYSRYLPMPIAQNEENFRAINEALDNIVNGKVKTILVHPNEFEEYLNGSENKEPVPVVNISDVKNSDRLQYLSHFHDDLLRRLYNMYGFDINSTSKLAQQNADEIKSMQGSSMIVPMNMLKEAQKAVEQFKTKFGWDITITFSEPWQLDMRVSEEGEIEEFTDNEEYENPEEHEITDNETEQ